ncbi:unnamed protein product [Ectocarpus sp. 13 AM-2016]
MLFSNLFVKLRDFNAAVDRMTPEQRKCCAETFSRIAMGEPVGVPRSCWADGTNCPLMKGLGQPGNLHQTTQLDPAISKKQSWPNGHSCYAPRGILVFASTSIFSLWMIRKVSRFMIRLLLARVPEPRALQSSLCRLVQMGMRTARHAAKVVDWVFIVSVVCSLHCPTGVTPLDWSTLALGISGTSVVFLALGDVEKHLDSPVLLRFLSSSYCGSTLAAEVARLPGFDWENFETLVLGFGGGGVWIVGLNNIHLFCALSDIVTNPLVRLAAATAAAASTAIAAVVLFYMDKPGDSKSMESTIMFYACASTSPLLLLFIRQVLPARLMERLRNSSVLTDVARLVCWR